MAFKYGTWWIRSSDADEVHKALDRHLAGKPPTSIVAVNCSMIDYGGKIIHYAAATIRYES